MGEIGCRRERSDRDLGLGAQIDSLFSPTSRPESRCLGHPLGASGTKLMATLLNELERTGGKSGPKVMCKGGSMANATIIERLD